MSTITRSGGSTLSVVTRRCLPPSRTSSLPRKKTSTPATRIVAIERAYHRVRTRDRPLLAFFSRVRDRARHRRPRGRDTPRRGRRRPGRRARARPLQRRRHLLRHAERVPASEGTAPSPASASSRRPAADSTHTARPTAASTSATCSGSSTRRGGRFPSFLPSDSEELEHPVDGDVEPPETVEEEQEPDRDEERAA